MNSMSICTHSLVEKNTSNRDDRCQVIIEDEHMRSTVQMDSWRGMQRLNGHGARLLKMGFRELGLTCGTFIGIPAFASCLLRLWFGDFLDVCAWNSKDF